MEKANARKMQRTAIPLTESRVEQMHLRTQFYSNRLNFFSPKSGSQQTQTYVHNVPTDNHYVLGFSQFYWIKNSLFQLEIVAT